MTTTVKKLRPRGQTRMSSKRQLTVPIAAAVAAGLEIGEQLEVTADGPGRVTISRARDAVEEVAGLLDRCYEGGYLDELRSEWR